MAAHYDDPTFSYLKYWQGRDYEHESEIIAIESLLAHHHFQTMTDIGGGYGRLIPTFTQYAATTTLVEPSAKQRTLATKLLSGLSNVSIVSGTAESSKLPSQSQELVSMIRVLHHLPHPGPAIQEVARILKPHGLFILEFANSFNLKSRLSSFFSGKPIPAIPIERRSLSSIRKQTISFVNHHPQAIRKLLLSAGFIPLRTLSVSNLRHPLVKRLLPLSVLIILESVLQPLLSVLYFGPSIFILAQRLDKKLTP